MRQLRADVHTRSMGGFSDHFERLNICALSSINDWIVLWEMGGV